MLFLKTLQNGQWVAVDSAEVIEVSISNTQLAAKGTLLNDRLYEFIEKRNALELQIEELDRKEGAYGAGRSQFGRCP